MKGNAKVRIPANTEGEKPRTPGEAVTRLVADTQRTPNMPFQEDELYVFPSEVQKIGLPRRGTVTLTL